MCLEYSIINEDTEHIDREWLNITDKYLGVISKTRLP